MKKLKLLLLTFIMCIPVFVYADMGAPKYIETFSATVINEDGADYYETEYDEDYSEYKHYDKNYYDVKNKVGKLKYNYKVNLYVDPNDDEIAVDKTDTYYIFNEKNNITNETEYYAVKKNDVTFVTDKYEPDKYDKLAKPVEIYLAKDTKMYAGPSMVFDELKEVAKGESLYEIAYAFGEQEWDSDKTTETALGSVDDATYVMVTYNGVTGWIKTTNVLFKVEDSEKYKYIFLKDIKLYKGYDKYEIKNNDIITNLSIYYTTYRSDSENGYNSCYMDYKGYNLYYTYNNGYELYTFYNDSPQKINLGIKVNLYKDAKNEYDTNIIGTLNAGDNILSYASAKDSNDDYYSDEGWYYVKSGNKVGWIHLTYTDEDYSGEISSFCIEYNDNDCTSAMPVKTITFKYVYEDLPDEVVHEATYKGRVGTEYSITAIAPEKSGYYLITTTLTGTVPEEDTTITVTYKKFKEEETASDEDEENKSKIYEYILIAGIVSLTALIVILLINRKKKDNKTNENLETKELDDASLEKTTVIDKKDIEKKK